MLISEQQLFLKLYHALLQQTIFGALTFASKIHRISMNSDVKIYFNIYQIFTICIQYKHLNVYSIESKVFLIFYHQIHIGNTNILISPKYKLNFYVTVHLECKSSSLAYLLLAFAIYQCIYEYHVRHLTSTCNVLLCKQSHEKNSCSSLALLLFGLFPFHRLISQN